MKALFISTIMLLIVSYSALSSPMLLGYDSTYLSSSNVGIYDCISYYQDSVSIECTVLLAYRGDLLQGDTINISLRHGISIPPTEVEDTLLVFADSSRVFAYGPHHPGYSLMNRDIGDGGLNILSDDDLTRLQMGDSLGERCCKAEITVHFPLSEEKIEFPINIYESLDEPMIVDIPEMGLFDVDLSINSYFFRNGYFPAFCQLTPINGEGCDYSRHALLLNGDIAYYRDGTYYINSQIKPCYNSEYFLTYDDFIRFLNDLDPYGGILQVEVQTTSPNCSLFTPIAYLTLTKSTQGRLLHSIDLLGVTSAERFQSHGEWNCAYFTNEGFLGNSLQHYEELIALRIPDEPMDGLRSFNYCLFNLSQDNFISADVSRVNFNTGDSSHLAEVRIRSFAPEYGIRLFRPKNESRHSSLAGETVRLQCVEELLNLFLFPSDAEFMQDEALEYVHQVFSIELLEQENEIVIAQEDGAHRHIQILGIGSSEDLMRAKLERFYNGASSCNIWATLCGEEEMEFQLRFDEIGNASLETGRMTFQEMPVLPGYYWYSNDQFILLEAQSGMDIYRALLVFNNTHANLTWKCRATAHEILRNVLSEESCQGTIYVAVYRADSSSSSESVNIKFMDFEYFGNNL